MLEKVPASKQSEDVGYHGGRGEPAEAAGPPEPIIWQTARQQLVSNWGPLLGGRVGGVLGPRSPCV